MKCPACVWINLCAYYVAYFSSCEKHFSVMWPKQCKTSLCWVGVYIKLGCELIPHFNRVVSLHYNCSSKKDFRVFFILHFFENWSHNKGDKGGMHSLFKNISQWIFLVSTAEYATCMVLQLAFPVCTQMCFLSFFHVPIATKDGIWKVHLGHVGDFNYFCQN